MPRPRRLQVAIALVVVLSAAGAAYAEWIVVRTPSPALLGRLVVHQPPAGFNAKAAQRAPVPSSKVVFQKEKSAVRRTPATAAQYSVTWRGDKHHTGATAELLVTMAPTTDVATALRSSAASEYLSTKKLATEGYTVTGSIPVPGVPGASGIALTSSSSALQTAAVVFDTHRFVVVDFVEEPGAAPTGAAVQLAQSEHRLLAAASSGVNLVETTYPFVASVVYWGSVVGAMVLGALVPAAVRRARRRRRARIEEASRRERLARGRKVASRRAPRRGSLPARR